MDGRRYAVIRRVFKPRTVLPMGFAIGLLVLWELGVLPVPFVSTAGPILRAVIAVGLAVVGAVVGFFVQWVVSRLGSAAEHAARDEGDG
jgi:hypothetical protein